jgi:hypothetical protein
MGTYKGDFYVPSLDEDYGDKVDNTITTVAKLARGDDALGNGVQIKGDYANPVDGDVKVDVAQGVVKYEQYNGTTYVPISENFKHEKTGYSDLPNNKYLNRRERFGFQRIVPKKVHVKAYLSQKPGGTPQQIKIVKFGDSYSNNVTPEITKCCENLIGAGTGFITNSGNFNDPASAGWDIIAGTFATDVNDGFKYWVMGQLPILAPSSRVKFLWGGGNAKATNIDIYYIREPNAGVIDLYIGGVSVATIDASHTEIDLGTYTYTIAGVPTTARVDLVHVSGNGVRIHTVNQRSTTVNGVLVYNASKGGSNMRDAMAIESCRNIFGTWLQTVNPDILVWTMQENTMENTLMADLDTFKSIIDSKVPLMDSVIIGSMPISSDSGIVQAEILEEWCYKNKNLHFFNEQLLVENYQELVDLGWGGDGVHIDYGFHNWAAGLIVNQLGLNSPIIGYSVKPVLNSIKPSRLATASVFGTTAIDGFVLSPVARTVDGRDWDIKSERAIYLRSRAGGEENGLLGLDGNGNAIAPWRIYLKEQNSSNSPTKSINCHNILGYTSFEFKDPAGSAIGGNATVISTMKTTSVTKATLLTNDSVFRDGVMLYCSDGGADGTGVMVYSKGEVGQKWYRVHDNVLVVL